MTDPKGNHTQKRVHRMAKRAKEARDARAIHAAALEKRREELDAEIAAGASDSGSGGNAQR